MTGQLFISLLNPGVSFLLALAFGLLWLHQRSRTYVLTGAIAYLCNMLGFLIQDVLPPWPHELHRIPSNLMFLLSACFLVSTVLARYDIKPPLRPLVLFTTLGMVGHVWFLLVDHSISARILIVSIALGGIASMIAIKLWNKPRTALIDKVLFWLSIASGANFIVRPVVILWIDGGYDSYEGFQQSLYWTTVQFTQAMIVISFALLLLVAFASDLVAELKRQAITDQLSGLLNRRGFQEKASAALALCAENQRPSGLMIVDFDHFKAINDSHGHAVGDAVIAVFGELVRQSLPRDAVAGRLGGEEFALFMPNADGRSIKNYAEFIRTGFTSLGASRLPEGVNPSLSVGLDIASPGRSLHDMMTNADAALYEAKRAGRNRVRIA